MAVCDYCQTTLIRDGDSVREQGKQSLTVEDYSPLQLGSVGVYQARPFAIVGRVQMQYSDGIWNDWYVQFADGGNGWLSEALGQYSLTTLHGEMPNLPKYDHLDIDVPVFIGTTQYRITDKRTAHILAGEGELPHVIGTGWQTWSADARHLRQFATLDYTSNYHQSTKANHPTVYIGEAVSLDDLQMQLLKDDSQIQQSVQFSGVAENDFSQNGETSATGKTEENSPALSPPPKKTNAQITLLDCPNCGSPVPYVAGATQFLLCPSCHSEISLQANTAQILQLHSMMQSVATSLKLGAKARISEADLQAVDSFSQDGFVQNSVATQNPTAQNNRSNALSHDFTVIGIQKLEEVGENATWTEYLLYSFTAGFVWLSEESKGWYLARVLDEHPIKSGNSLTFADKKWVNNLGRSHLEESYQSKVIFAMGAFNWRVKLNDVMTLTDYFNGSRLITSEQNSEEITYTLASRVTHQQLTNWFGEQIDAPQGLGTGTSQPTQGGYGQFWLIMFAYVVLYLFLFAGSLGAFGVTVLFMVVTAIVYAVMTSSKHDYDGLGAIVSSIVRDKSAMPSLVGWGLVVVCVVVNMLIFGLTHTSGSSSSSSYSSSGGYYSSDGREGYTSSGSHK